MSEDLSLEPQDAAGDQSISAQYDVIIIGGGPAGLSAGIYTSRAKLNTILVEKGPLGGQLSWVKRIDNYPGFPKGISGGELTDLMVSQAERFGLQVETGSVIDITNGSQLKTVKTDIRNLRAKALIITTGVSRKRQSIDGEEKFQGRGVSYCATCDGPFFKGVSVAIVGGGDEALEEAIFLTKFANEITIIHSEDKLSASEELQKTAQSKENISFLFNSKIAKICGKDRVDLIEVMDLDTGDTEQLPVGGVFLYIGTRPAKEFLSQLIEMDERGYIITDQDMRTNVEGIFAAGDVRYKEVRQVATAVGDGVTAASSARKYIQILHSKDQ